MDLPEDERRSENASGCLDDVKAGSDAEIPPEGLYGEESADPMEKTGDFILERAPEKPSVPAFASTEKGRNPGEKDSPSPALGTSTSRGFSLLKISGREQIFSDGSPAESMKVAPEKRRRTPQSALTETSSSVTKLSSV